MQETKSALHIAVSIRFFTRHLFTRHFGDFLSAHDILNAETVSSFSSQWGTTVSELSTQARRQLDDVTQQMGPQAGDIAQRVSNAAAKLTDQVTQSVTAEVNAAATSATQALSTGSMSPIMANVALQVGAGVVTLAIIALVTGSLRSAKGPTACISFVSSALASVLHSSAVLAV